MQNIAFGSGPIGGIVSGWLAPVGNDVTQVGLGAETT